MVISKSIDALFALGLGTLSIAGASAQTYPNKAVHLVTAEPGGASDFAARLIGQGISGPLGQTVVVDNRPSLIAMETVMRAQPDGYTVLVSGTNFYSTPLLRSTAYDPIKDFAPITIASGMPNLVVVHPSLPVKNVKELIALAKAKPGVLNYASAGVGFPSHLAGELFKSMAGVSIVHIPYKGNGQAMNDLIGGQLDVMFPSAGTGAPHIKSGRIKALAVATPRPSVLFPKLPTVTASGLPGYESDQITVLLAPARTPDAIINRLNQEVVQLMMKPDIKEKYMNLGVETIGSSPEQLAAKMREDMARLSKVIKDAGIRAE